MVMLTPILHGDEIAAGSLPYFAPREDISISDAVQQFNDRASADPIGKTQPSLTKEEVLAAIRGWKVDNHPHSDIFLKRFQKIAETGIIPKGCYLDFIPGWKGYNGYDYTVWWIDLFVGSEKPGEKVQDSFGYNYRLRAQMISSKLHEGSSTNANEQKVLLDAYKKIQTDNK